MTGPVLAYVNLAKIERNVKSRRDARRRVDRFTFEYTGVTAAGIVETDGHGMPTKYRVAFEAPRGWNMAADFRAHNVTTIGPARSITIPATCDNTLVALREYNAACTAEAHSYNARRALGGMRATNPFKGWLS